MSKKPKRNELAVAFVATANSPMGLGRFHHMDNRSMYILRYILDKTYGSFCILSSDDYKLIARKIRVDARSVRRKIDTMVKYELMNKDMSVKPHKLLVLAKGKAVASCDSGSKATVKSLVVSDQPSQVTPDLPRPHDIWVHLWVKEPNTLSKDINMNEWNRRRDKIINLKFPGENHSTMELRNKNTIYEFKYEDIRVRSTPHLFILKVFSDKSRKLFSVPERATMEIFSIIERVAPKLENIFKVKLVWDNKIEAEISKESYALVKNVFAREMLEARKIFKERTGKEIDVNVYGDKGEILYTPDYSLGVNLPEMDSELGKGIDEKNRNPGLYTRRLQDCCSEIGEGRFSPKSVNKEIATTKETLGQTAVFLRDTNKNVDNIAKNMNNLVKIVDNTNTAVRSGAENQEYYGKHFVSHIDVLNSLKCEVGGLAGIMDGFRNAIKTLESKIAAMTLPEDKKPVYVEITDDTGKFEGFLPTGELHSFDLKPPAKIWLERQTANAVISKRKGRLI